MKRSACLVPAAVAAAMLLTGCGTHRDRTPAETDRRDSVFDDARDLTSDAVRDGRELASDAVQNGRELVSSAAEDVSDAMDKSDSDGEYRTDSDGRVKPDER